MEIYEIENRTSAIVARLLDVWEASVRETHSFLTEESIEGLRPLVNEGIKNIPNLMVVEDTFGELLAFMGVAERKIEMLFVAPEARGKGLGKSLVNYAINSLNCVFVDVNEQNPQAVGFYKKVGFVVYERSELDSQGNPYPILHMRLERS